MSRLSGMEIFVRVVEVGSFSGAARELGVSKSHVSKKLSQLEERLGARLLQRTTRRLSLTEIGRAYFERSLQIIADIEEAELAVRELQDHPRGLLRLSAPMSFGMLHLGPVLTSFMRIYPDVRIDLTLTDRRVDLIDEGFDLAVRIGQLHDSSLIARKIAPVQRIVCASPSYLKEYTTPKHPHELKHHNCLLYSYQSTGTTWPFLGPNGPFTCSVQGRLQANNGDILREAALKGLGIALLPDFLVRDDLAEKTLTPILSDWAPKHTTLWVLYPHNRHLSTKVRIFIEHMKDTLKHLQHHSSLEPRNSTP